jgi:hypothetical protein
MDRAARCITGARGQVGVNIEEMIPAETGEAATRFYWQHVTAGNIANPSRRTPSPAAHVPARRMKFLPTPRARPASDHRMKGPVLDNLIADERATCSGRSAKARDGPAKR